MVDDLNQRIPIFYGSVTVGERGQVAIPAEARRDQDINPGEKLLAFGGPEKKALIFIKVESVTEFLTSISDVLAEFERTYGSGTANESTVKSNK